jgi:cytoskeletal protein RodZ
MDQNKDGRMRRDGKGGTGQKMSQLYSSRSEIQAKKRRMNKMLNTLIGIVLVLIVFVSAGLIFGNDAEEAKPEKELNTEPSKSELKVKENEEKQLNQETEEINEESEEQPIDEENSPYLTEEEDSSQVRITEGEPGSNVEKVIENPAWQPIGTVQSEPHVATYKKNSVDWQEMTRAISYATGLAESDMIIWHLGNNGGPNKAVGTVTSKDQQQVYRVYIDWVENQGWKPVRVEQLKER